MRVDWNRTINGYRMIEIRDFLREMRRYRNSEHIHCASKFLGDDRVKNTQTMKLLEKEGFVEFKAEDNWGIKTSTRQWLTTTLGDALCCAKAVKPIPRAKADKIYAGILERIEMVSTDDNYLYEVEYLLVFGSYIRDTADCGDLDIVLKLRPKAKFNKGQASFPMSDAFAKMSREQFRNEAPASMEYYRYDLTFSQIKVERAIKNRIAAISLMCESNLQNEAKIPFKIGYMAPNATPLVNQLGWSRRLQNEPEPEFFSPPAAQAQKIAA